MKEKGDQCILVCSSSGNVLRLVLVGCVIPTGRIVSLDINFYKQESLLCLACDYISYSPSLTDSKDLSSFQMVGSDNEYDNASVHNETANTQQQPNIQPQIITTVSNNNAKFPYLKKDEYEVWAMKMEYWITNNDINIWKSIPDDHVVDFHYMDDARDIWNAVKARFGGNAESKKMRKSMPKKEFLEFRTGWDDSAYSVSTTTSEDVEGRPIFYRFAKTDSMKVVPPPLTRDYTYVSYHIDLGESQMSYGTKSSTSCNSKSMSNDFVSCDNSDKSSEVNTNDFPFNDSSVKSSEHQPNDSTSCASTSSVSTSVNEVEIESNVRTPIKEPIIV
nr:ribonuclease H-like domain-containing protein [Tanacetum cinerariifolium]